MNQKEDNIQFLEDLKFIQLLLNKEYIFYLIDLNLFKENQFLIFLKYLRYFNKIEYITCLIYPDCLIILEKLIDLLEKYFFSDFFSSYFDLIETIKSISVEVDKKMELLYSGFF